MTICSFFVRPARQPVLNNIGLFDSGIGGLSILSEIANTLPQTALHYVADSGFAPYGNQSADYVKARSIVICDHLIAQGAQLIVVACNTATAIAIADLRTRYSVPIVGVEPGIKPGVEQSRNKIVGVLATENTIASEKFQRLANQYHDQAQLIMQPCAGWAAMIEQGTQNEHHGQALIATHLHPALKAGADTLVLGCTHYTFIRDAITQLAASMGRTDIRIVNPAQAIARRVQDLIELHQLVLPQISPSTNLLRLSTSGSTDSFAHQIRQLPDLNNLQPYVNGIESMPVRTDRIDHIQ